MPMAMPLPPLLMSPTETAPRSPRQSPLHRCRRRRCPERHPRHSGEAHAVASHGRVDTMIHGSPTPSWCALATEALSAPVMSRSEVRSTFGLVMTILPVLTRQSQMADGSPGDAPATRLSVMNWSSRYWIMSRANPLREKIRLSATFPVSPAIAPPRPARQCPPRPGRSAGARRVFDQRRARP